MAGLIKKSKSWAAAEEPRKGISRTASTFAFWMDVKKSESANGFLGKKVKTLAWKPWRNTLGAKHSINPPSARSTSFEFVSASERDSDSYGDPQAGSFYVEDEEFDTRGKAIAPELLSHLSFRLSSPAHSSTKVMLIKPEKGKKKYSTQGLFDQNIESIGPAFNRTKFSMPSM